MFYFCMFEVFFFYILVDNRFVFCFISFCMIFEVLFFSTLKHIPFLGLNMLVHHASLIIGSLPSTLKLRN